MEEEGQILEKMVHRRWWSVRASVTKQVAVSWLPAIQCIFSTSVGRHCWGSGASSAVFPQTRNSLFRNACHTERRPFRIWVRCIEGVYLRNTLFRIPQTHSHQAVWDTVFILQSHSIGNLHHEQSSMKISLGNIIFIGVEWWKWHWFVWNLSLRLDMNTARNFYVAIDMQVIFWVNMCKNMLFWLCYCLIFRRKWRPRPGSCSLIVEDESRLTMTKVCFSLDVSLELLVSK